MVAEPTRRPYSFGAFKYHNVHAILKVKSLSLFLCLIKHNTMKADGRVEVYLHAFLTSVLGGGDWRASHPTELPLIIFE
jgi:hypothetical protein